MYYCLELSKRFCNLYMYVFSSSRFSWPKVDVCNSRGHASGRSHREPSCYYISPTCPLRRFQCALVLTTIEATAPLFYLCSCETIVCVPPITGRGKSERCRNPRRDREEADGSTSGEAGCSRPGIPHTGDDFCPPKTMKYLIRYIILLFLVLQKPNKQLFD